MQSCSSALCILILLTSTFTTVSESAVGPVKVKLHDSATLPCSERCSGLVRWTVFHKPTDVLAECDQTSCRSKEGYQMIHDQYLKGNLSLTITEADFSKRGWYTSDCDGKDICDVQLQIEPLNTTVQIEPGESLVLKLDISDPVAVIYNSTVAAGPSSGQICKVDGGDQSVLDTDEGAAVPEWVIVLSVMGAALVAVIMVSVVVIVRLRRENQLLQAEDTNAEQSWMWKDEYQQGLKIGALGFGIGALVLALHTPPVGGGKAPYGPAERHSDRSFSFPPKP
ncbi:uncharacterized protein LOC118827061 [Colossoma macropomum]|uniref:uncharacterized protein LOC118827061 n=1 Tax=Colossoma macropomum TaxID=42526 RepID=UPI001865531B|nr:uncharacterized protein LOC118827061 [Colossoma macropomum]